MTRRDIPNLITLFRFALVLPIMLAMLASEFAWALVLFLIAGISDGIDGLLAKQYHWQSRLGSILDPLADKVLIIASFAVLSYLLILPVGLFLLVIARDLMIVVGALAYHRWVGEFELLPLLSSKLNTLMQIILVLWVMFQQVWFAQWHIITTILLWLTVISLVYSGVEYILVWGKRAWHQTKRK